MLVDTTDTPPVVLLTDPIHGAAHARLKQDAEVIMIPAGITAAKAAGHLRELVGQADGLIVRRPLPVDMFDTPNRLRAVVRHGAGVDFIPVEQLTKRGVPVANVPGANANAVAEYAISAMLAASRRLAEFDQHIRNHAWHMRSTASTVAMELRNRTLGIVGYGAIGSRIAEIACNGFSMNVLVHTNTPSRLPAHFRSAMLQELVSVCDFVVLACPLTPRTEGMINTSVLDHANGRLVLINVARGAIVREDDLLLALEAGKLSGAVLDVFQTEPLPPDSPLHLHPRVMLTPHLAGVTQDSEHALGVAAVDTVLALLRGECHVNIVNPSYSKHAV